MKVFDSNWETQSHIQTFLKSHLHSGGFLLSLLILNRRKIWSVHALRNINMPTQSRCCFVINKHPPFLLLLLTSCLHLHLLLLSRCKHHSTTARRFIATTRRMTDSLYTPAKPPSLCLTCFSVNADSLTWGVVIDRLVKNSVDLAQHH